jgi:hypothetical protein
MPPAPKLKQQTSPFEQLVVVVQESDAPLHEPMGVQVALFARPPPTPTCAQHTSVPGSHVLVPHAMLPPSEPEPLLLLLEDAPDEELDAPLDPELPPEDVDPELPLLEDDDAPLLDAGPSVATSSDAEASSCPVPGISGSSP